MARKQAILLASTPVVLGREAKLTLKRMEAIKVPAGTEEHYYRWIKATREVEEQGARCDALMALVEKKGSADPNWPAYQDALRKYQRCISTALGACDAWAYFRDHKDDKVGVPEEEVRAIVIDSLSDKLDGLLFSVNSGMLGSKIAQAIRKITSEESSGTAPYCDDCK